MLIITIWNNKVSWTSHWHTQTEKDLVCNSRLWVATLLIIAFPIFMPSLHSLCMHVWLYINGIAGTCQAMVQRESIIFRHYLWNSWDSGFNVFSVATTKCTGLIKPWSNFGLIFCLSCEFFYNCSRSSVDNHCFRIEDFFFLWQKLLGDAFDRNCWAATCCSTHVSNWWPAGQMRPATSF